MPFIEIKLYMKKAILGLHSNAAFLLLATSNCNKPTKTFYGGGKLAWKALKDTIYNSS